jgi:hypothetical protein
LTAKPNQLGNPQTGLHGNQDEGSIATADPGGTIRNREQCIDLFSVEELDRPPNMAFIGHRQDPLAVQGMRGFFQSHVPEERVDGSQPNVPRTSAVFASAFQVIEEETKEGSIKVFDAELGWAFAESFFGEFQQQAKRISVSRYGVWACLPLAKQTIGEESLKERRKAGDYHGCTSRGINRSVAS